jgi:ABC-type sugar transport system ATPase subunit
LSAALEVEDATRRFGGVEALRELSLSVAPGELVAVLGASGSGKSTLLRVIAGLEPLDGGRVLIDGSDQTRVEPARRGVAMVFQSFALFPHLSVERNIAFGLRARSEPRTVIEARVRETATALQLDALLERRPGELSGGERQRVALARALAARPRVLLLDEPMSNLDAQLRGSARAEIRRVQEQTGVTTLHVTHDQGEALALGHRVALMREGRLEQLGTPDEVWERPASTWVAGFVGTPPMNLLRGENPVLDPGGDVVGFRAEDGSCHVTDSGGCVFELSERAGADRLWHLRAGQEPIVVRVPEGLEAPVRGARVAVTVPPDRVRRFDAVTGQALP